MTAQPGPFTAACLDTARTAALAAMSASSPAASRVNVRGALRSLDREGLLDVAALLAALVGRRELVFSEDEWVELRPLLEEDTP